MMSACSTLRWYSQAIDGHFHILGQREPIRQVIDNPHTDARLKERLTAALTIRDFASTELHLPDNNSYREYADIGRDSPVWNVVASRSLSFDAHEWCYPLVGCLNYRGWYRKASAQEEARLLATQHYDVLVSPVIAYSTLGWFSDPLLPGMLRYSDARLAELLFHELAHQQLFVKGDTSFNEAFAETVAHAGVEHWLMAQHNEQALRNWRADRAVREEINQLILKTRNALEAVYQNNNNEERLRGKERLIMTLRHDYLKLLSAEPTDSPRHHALRAWGEWFAQPLNNANFVLFSVYQQGVKRFQQLLQCLSGDLMTFYEHAEKMQEWTTQQRHTWLTTRLDIPADCEQP